MCTNIITETERKELLSNIKHLLGEYDYRFTDEALNKIIDEWAKNKAPLIEAFKKHPNYKEGKFMIAFDYNYERKLDPTETRNFIDWICCRSTLMELRGKLPEDMVAVADEEEARIPCKIYNFFNRDLQHMVERTVTEEMANHINGLFPDAHAHTGQKTSRVINKVCKLCYIDQLKDYNRMFAKYADSLTPLVITRHTVLSINPLDYLTMSFGNSWASCHTIDKKNKRNMPNDYSGCYSSGTISYMLDKPSMVFYTVDGEYNGDELWNEPKITRQMFHWGEDKLVQARLYPQSNDGDDFIYTPNRTIVQEIMATIMDVPNLWTLKRGTNAIGKYVLSAGTHYRDYTSYENCTISILRERENTNEFTVGHSPICVECGREHSNCETINHCHAPGFVCANCGDRYDDEDYLHYIDGEYYCEDCCNWCSLCETWHLEEETYVNGIGDVCSTCRDYHCSYCEECDEWYHEDCVRYVESREIHVCDRCYDRHYNVCDQCGNDFHNHDLTAHDDGNTYCEECLARINAAAEAEAEEEAC